MDLTAVAKPCNLGNKSTSDVILRLRNGEGRPEWFYSHSSILINKSGFFADQLSNPDSGPCIEIQCSDSTYDHHVNLLRLLYLPADSLLDSLGSVKSAIGILQLAVAFHCEDITNCCIQYLEAIPWEDKEEEQILQAVAKLGPIAMPILARIQPVDVSATKNVFVSAVRFATSIGGSCPPFGDELKTSAQEQVEFMLGGDEDTPLVTADDEVKSVVKMGLSQVCSSFEKELSSLLVISDITTETAENRILQSLYDVEWMCNILPKMDLMKDFVSSWAEMSGKVLGVVEDKKFDTVMWGLKMKLIEVTGKVLEAVGYGNVILPAPCRVQLLKTWLPYIRKMKPLLDAMGNKEIDFPYKMDEDLCQSIEGAIVSLVLALPSNDQAEILSDWMNTEQVRYPDLSEAFEVWCYRTKSAKRRLMEGLDRVGNTTISL
ncbi:BTB/POZ domain-containing protein At3g05675-like [Durio zibethinus]|uniref:BTB/POZ domain-containing protein At3g05675-like n=1 Tax=Durio zibethinus TaxID=66656 RepID=A0A6P5Y9S9_DURZI|nr:BTB/POZ domain-containing protein At3g05675-like [Durio zibethinus]XP_022737208.1 BTB/POZ domain-containing protein At3g05675-like [Durio zibethinus]XP_022737209.1 BTB/POZ domain-containing protein At3g05675-like [Durio zibethinus]